MSRSRAALPPAGLLLVLALLGAMPGPAPAREESFQVWLEALRREAAGQGISPRTLERALADARVIDRVVELDRRQPELTKTFWSYLDARVTPRRVERGRRLLRRHRTLLERVRRRYGVPARYLVAFWGLETDYGRHLGAFPVFGALATLAYDERRSAFFRAQLLAALRIVERGYSAPAQMRGSWAGAMGHLQFLPTTFLRHAVDADGDGRRDVWRALPDVFASGAKFLSDLGWREGERWGREVRVPAGFDWSLARLEVTRPLAAWSAMGVRRADGGALPRSDMEGAIVLPQGHEGPAFLVYDNFEVILDWNRSIHYAVAVGHLADRLIGAPPLRTGRDVDDRALSREQVMELQRRLAARGFEPGATDGVPGPGTRAAVRAYQASAGLPADGYPSPALLEHLRARGGEPRARSGG